MLTQNRIPSGYTALPWDYCRLAEQTIHRLQRKNLASLSPNDKDALIGALSTLVVASGRGFRPSANVISALCNNEYIKD